jgi:hypothetical protein
MNLLKEPIVTIDLLNDFIVVHNPIRKGMISDELKERFVPTIDSFWNSDKDKLDYFCLYNDGEYFCQRKKLKYDFKNEVNYWVTYSFTGASKEQAQQFKDHLFDFFEVIKEVKEIQIEEKIQEIDSEAIFFEERYLKKKREKMELLQLSDWRVLPDVEDTYPDEKDMWVKWRAYIRNSLLKRPSDFADQPNPNLAFFKWTHDIKYPVDPSNYMKLYPNKMLEDGVTPAPEYMDENDASQWVSNDGQASSDFMKSRELVIYNLNNQYKPSYRKVRQSVLDLMKLLGVDDMANVNWDEYFIDESQIG